MKKLVDLNNNEAFIGPVKKEQDKRMIEESLLEDFFEEGKAEGKIEGKGEVAVNLIEFGIDMDSVIDST